MMIAAVPLRFWRASLGLAERGGAAPPGEAMRREARRLAIHVERAASRLPGTSDCLPRAMALSALLRRAGLPHALVMAARPAAFTGPGDRLHAWVEQAGERLIGDLPGPWIETLRLGARAA
jgi:hypothetical protein